MFNHVFVQFSKKKNGKCHAVPTGHEWVRCNFLHYNTTTYCGYIINIPQQIQIQRKEFECNACWQCLGSLLATEFLQKNNLEHPLIYKG